MSPDPPVPKLRDRHSYYRNAPREAPLGRAGLAILLRALLGYHVFQGFPAGQLVGRKSGRTPRSVVMLDRPQAAANRPRQIHAIVDHQARHLLPIVSPADLQLLFYNINLCSAFEHRQDSLAIIQWPRSKQQNKVEQRNRNRRQ